MFELGQLASLLACATKRCLGDSLLELAVELPIRVAGSPVAQDVVGVTKVSADEALEEATTIVVAHPDSACVLRRVHGEQHGVVEVVGPRERKEARVVEGLSVEQR